MAKWLIIHTIFDINQEFLLLWTLFLFLSLVVDIIVIKYVLIVVELRALLLFFGTFLDSLSFILWVVTTFVLILPLIIII